MKRVLVTGALGQIGTALLPVLIERFGATNIIASDIKPASAAKLPSELIYENLDVRQADQIAALVRKHQIDTIFHMAAILSASGEKNPHLAWEVNLLGTYNILEVARELELVRVFVPSSIAVFGPETPRENTPQDTILRPRTMYGLTKVTGELLSEYYVHRFGLDVRGCRYPGIISHEALPGGGTTDYAVEIFYEAIKQKKYTCFVRAETRLPMMYMPDCLKATLQLMEADFSRLIHHAGFNVAAMSFSAGELAAEIKKHIPEFECTFEPDYRQKIADTWPSSIDDSAAREEWDWQPDYDLARMTEDMLRVLTARYQQGLL
ncbi:MAG: L-threonine 3-dehydrogenase [Candidatus Aminicenantes bacterium]|nr:NAD-dependent epimerase/dehydratase family protein [Deltaproteobacteria bacterium]MCD6192320.1 NAD-dependent epimerase/dehydratase family protein [Candidatus Aminicenantes bacterium]RLD99985.1 MAG: L-threonine 3-dehydrogenase [Candidatus Aminicenantes bacterium]RLE06017.1 MAG: L-threonine 3-dehydrogenase [Candidatus Aminicenantes bacterium]